MKLFRKLNKKFSENDKICFLFSVVGTAAAFVLLHGLSKSGSACGRGARRQFQANTGRTGKAVQN